MEYKRYEIGCILESNRVSHLKATIEEVNCFINRTNSYRIICLFSSHNCFELKKRGIEADMMEDWLSVSAVKRKHEEYRKYIKSLKQIFKQDETGYFSRAFRFLLQEHLYYHVFMNYMKDAVFDAYYSYNSFEKISLDGWSWPTIEWGAYIYKKPYTRIYGKLSYMLVGSMKWVDPYTHIYDCVFLPPIGEDQQYRYQDKSILKYSSMESEPYYRLWKKRITNYSLCETDDLRNGFSILYVPTASLFGYYRQNDRFLETTLSILNDFGAKIYFKLHPDECAKTTNKIRLCKKKMSNVILLDKSESVDEYIDSVDLVITDLSTVFMQAICAQKPVIMELSSIDVPERLVQFQKQYVEVTTDFEDFVYLLNSIMKTKASFIEWRNNRVYKQNGFFTPPNGIKMENYWDFILDGAT